ncbi:hypothetical protein ACTXT7_009312 [Hymenolepis weldensis]
MRPQPLYIAKMAHLSGIESSDSELESESWCNGTQTGLALNNRDTGAQAKIRNLNSELKPSRRDSKANF